jgi:hypothetical protein
MPKITGLVDARTPAGKAAILEQLRGKQERGNKYGAIKVSNEHGNFDSKREANRVYDLVVMQEQGIIRNLKLDKRDLKYEFSMNGSHIGNYTADAAFMACQDFELYTERGTVYCKEGNLYVCDAKSSATRKSRDWPLRKNMMHALFGIDVIEM